MVLEKSKYYILLTMAMAFWGLSWPISKLLVELTSQITIGFFRFFIASCIFVPVFLVLMKKENRIYTRRFLLDISILGIIGIFGYGMLYLTGMKFTTASQGAMIAGIQPALISIIAYIFLKERLSKKWQYSGIVISFIGVIFIVGIRQIFEFNKEHLIGNIIVLIGFVFWSLYTTYGKTVMKKVSSFEVTAGATFVGMILFGISASIENNWSSLVNIKPFFWIGVCILGLLPTVLGFFFYFTAVSKIGATHTGIFINLVPIFGTIFSFLLIKGETIDWTFIVGLVLICVGVLVINFPKNLRKNESKTDEYPNLINE